MKQVGYDVPFNSNLGFQYLFPIITELQFNDLSLFLPSKYIFTNVFCLDHPTRNRKDLA